MRIVFTIVIFSFHTDKKRAKKQRHLSERRKCDQLWDEQTLQVHRVSNAKLKQHNAIRHFLNVRSNAVIESVKLSHSIHSISNSKETIILEHVVSVMVRDVKLCTSLHKNTDSKVVGILLGRLLNKGLKTMSCNSNAVLQHWIAMSI